MNDKGTKISVKRKAGWVGVRKFVVMVVIGVRLCSARRSFDGVNGKVAKAGGL